MVPDRLESGCLLTWPSSRRAANSGVSSFRPVEVVAPRGSVLNWTHADIQN